MKKMYSGTEKAVCLNKGISEALGNKVFIASIALLAGALIFGNIRVQAADNYGRSVSNAFEHVTESNGRIEYDYESDGDLTGVNDVVLDAEDIKALEKKTEVTLFGNFVPEKDQYGDNTGTGTLYIRIGENPQ